MTVSAVESGLVWAGRSISGAPRKDVASRATLSLPARAERMDAIASLFVVNLLLLFVVFII